MKKKLKKIAVIALGAMLVNSAVAYGGTWEQDGEAWYYMDDDGQYAEYEWIQGADGAWYYVGRFGLMVTNRLIDRYYIGADGRMLSEQDTENPLQDVTIYGTCYMSVNSYEDKGAFYRANVTLYDSSYGTAEMFSRYKKGDKFWIESAGTYGTVSAFNFSTAGDVSLDVTCNGVTYSLTPEDTFASGPEGESLVVRKIKDNVVVDIPKNVEIVPDSRFMQFRLSLDDLLQNSVFKMTPVFKGKTVEKLYDDMINYAG